MGRADSPAFGILLTMDGASGASAVDNMHAKSAQRAWDQLASPSQSAIRNLPGGGEGPFVSQTSDEIECQYLVAEISVEVE